MQAGNSSAKSVQNTPKQGAEQCPGQHLLQYPGQYSQQSPRQYVVVRLSALGDVVLTTGVLEHWHKTRGWRFVVLTRPGLGSIFNGHPAVDEVLGLEKAQLDFPASLGTFRKLARNYKGLGLIDLHDNLRTRLLGAVWQGEVLRYHKLSIQRRAFLLSGHRLFEQDLLAYNVPQRYALAVDSLAPDATELVPRIFITQAEQTEAKKFLAEKHLAASAPVVALHPFATHPQKAWPYEHWRQLLSGLKALGLNWIIVGQDAASPFKQLSARELAGGGDFTNLTNLRQTCALLGQAAMLITGDSGPMHLACAVNTPVLALFGPTTRHWGFFPSGATNRVLEAQTPGRPYSLHGQATGQNKGQNCMATISCAAVLAEVREMLKL